MPVNRKDVEKALDEALAAKGERKFTQSIDLAFNFKDVDFKKAEQRLSAEVVLPFAPKAVKVGVFADGQLATDAQKAGAEMVFSTAQIDAFSKDKKKQKELLDYALLAAPQMMVVVGKAFGQLLGGKGKLPKPILPNANLSVLVSNARKTIVVKAKGKFLPSVHCVIGRENQPKDEVVENIIAVLDAVEKKINSQNIRSVFVKTTMGKPVRIPVQGN